jgi:hypothetical protein
MRTRRARSENVGCGSYMRNASSWQRAEDARHEPCDESERFPIWMNRKKKKTSNANSIAFEQKYYSERYS